MEMLALPPFASVQRVRQLEAVEMDTLCRRVLAASPDSWSKPLGQGLATYCRKGSRLNKVVGLGLASLNADLALHLQDAEQAYAQSQAPIQVEVCTHACPSLTNVLAARGYQCTGHMMVLGCSLTQRVPATETTIEGTVKTRLVAQHEAYLWAEVLAQGFSAVTRGEHSAKHDVVDRSPLRQLFADVGRIDSTYRWLAEIDGQPAGGASLDVSGGVAQLAHAATLPKYRGHGVQPALLAARLTQASQVGCAFAVLATRPGSVSQRNAQRAGFVPLYARAIWSRAPTRA